MAVSTEAQANGTASSEAASDRVRSRWIAAGGILAAALWLTARIVAAGPVQIGAFRDEISLGILVLVGTAVYAGSVLVLFGRRWLVSLVR